MNIYVLTDRCQYTKVITTIANNVSSLITVREVNANVPMIRESIKYMDLFIIDDRFYSTNSLNSFGILKKIKQSVVVLLESKENIGRYIGLNIEHYFEVPLEWNDLQIVISKLFDKYSNVDNGSYNYINYAIKTKSGYKYFEYENILFFERATNSVIINTRGGEYTVKETLANIIKDMPSSFARVHDLFIVNYYNVAGLKDDNSKTYSLFFDNCEKVAYMSKYKYQKCIGNLNVDSILEFEKEGITLV